MQNINHLCEEFCLNLAADPTSLSDFIRQSVKELSSLSRLVRPLSNYGPILASKNYLEPISSGESSPCFSEEEEENSSTQKHRKNEFSLYEIGKMFLDSSSIIEITQSNSWYSWILIHGLSDEKDVSVLLRLMDKHLKQSKFETVKTVVYKGQKSFLMQFKEHITAQKAFSFLSDDLYAKTFIKDRWQVIRVHNRMAEPKYMSQFSGIILTNLPSDCTCETLLSVVKMNCSNISCLSFEIPVLIGDSYSSLIRTETLDDAERLALTLNGLETENGVIRAGLHPDCSLTYRDISKDPFKEIRRSQASLSEGKIHSKNNIKKILSIFKVAQPSKATFENKDFDQKDLHENIEKIQRDSIHKADFRGFSAEQERPQRIKIEEKRIEELSYEDSIFNPKLDKSTGAEDFFNLQTEDETQRGDTYLSQNIPAIEINSQIYKRPPPPPNFSQNHNNNPMSERIYPRESEIHSSPSQKSSNLSINQEFIMSPYKNRASNYLDRNYYDTQERSFNENQQAQTNNSRQIYLNQTINNRKHENLNFQQNYHQNFPEQNFLIENETNFKDRKFRNFRDIQRVENHFYPYDDKGGNNHYIDSMNPCRSIGSPSFAKFKTSQAFIPDIEPRKVISLPIGKYKKKIKKVALLSKKCSDFLSSLKASKNLEATNKVKKQTKTNVTKSSKIRMKRKLAKTKKAKNLLQNKLNLNQIPSNTEAFEDNQNLTNLGVSSSMVFNRDSTDSVKNSNLYNCKNLNRVGEYQSGRQVWQTDLANKTSNMPPQVLVPTVKNIPIKPEKIEVQENSLINSEFKILYVPNTNQGLNRMTYQNHLKNLKDRSAAQNLAVISNASENVVRLNGEDTSVIEQTLNTEAISAQNDESNNVQSVQNNILQNSIQEWKIVYTQDQPSQSKEISEPSYFGTKKNSVPYEILNTSIYKGDPSIILNPLMQSLPHYNTNYTNIEDAREPPRNTYNSMLVNSMNPPQTDQKSLQINRKNLGPDQSKQNLESKKDEKYRSDFKKSSFVETPKDKKFLKQRDLQKLKKNFFDFKKRSVDINDGFYDWQSDSNLNHNFKNNLRGFSSSSSSSVDENYRQISFGPKKVHYNKDVLNVEDNKNKTSMRLEPVESPKSLNLSTYAFQHEKVSRINEKQIENMNEEIEVRNKSLNPSPQKSENSAEDLKSWSINYYSGVKTLLDNNQLDLKKLPKAFAEESIQKPIPVKEDSRLPFYMRAKDPTQLKSKIDICKKSTDCQKLQYVENGSTKDASKDTRIRSSSGLDPRSLDIACNKNPQTSLPSRKYEPPPFTPSILLNQTYASFSTYQVPQPIIVQPSQSENKNIHQDQEDKTPKKKSRRQKNLKNERNPFLTPMNQMNFMGCVPHPSNLGYVYMPTMSTMASTITCSSLMMNMMSQNILPLNPPIMLYPNNLFANPLKDIHQSQSSASSGPGDQSVQASNYSNQNNLQSHNQDFKLSTQDFGYNFSGLGANK